MLQAFNRKRNALAGVLAADCIAKATENDYIYIYTHTLAYALMRGFRGTFYFHFSPKSNHIHTK